MGMMLDGIGERIRHLRQGAGLSQRELAHLTGMTQPSLCRVEAGQMELRISGLIALAEALEVCTAELIEMPDEHLSHR